MTKIVIAEQTHKWVERCEELQKENAQLKELLKECKDLFNRATVDGEEPSNGELIMILTKIEEVLK